MKTAKTVIDNAQNIVTSTFGGINLRDFARGLIIMVLFTALTAIQTALALPGGFSAIDWNEILLDTVKAGLSYIILNWLSPAKVLITNPSKSFVAAVKAAKQDAKESEVPVELMMKPTKPDDTVSTSRGDFNVNPEK